MNEDIKDFVEDCLDEKENFSKAEVVAIIVAIFNAMGNGLIKYRDEILNNKKSKGVDE